jgi:hypothetical protein
MNDSYEIPAEEIPLAESLFITSHLSPYHYRWWKGLTKNGFKKVIKKLGKELLIFNYRYAILLIEQMFEK